ncbi:MAG: zinc ribbon domain-containing protein [Rhodobacterales bacterium]|nr:zinc ribbon domain-containing protein [Rhodobacterales bacterium]
MPIYEYICGDCGHAFEKLRRMSAEPPPCPSCSGGHCEKQISASAFILKGSGWYKDHYGLKNSGSSDGASSSNGEATSDDAPRSPATETQTKPASSAAATTAPTAPAPKAPSPSTKASS